MGRSRKETMRHPCLSPPTTPTASHSATARKQSARPLLRLGMRRCSLRLVHYQAEPRPLRLDWYGLYWRWLRALHLANPSGADFLFEDLRARYSALTEVSELAAVRWYG